MFNYFWDVRKTTPFTGDHPAALYPA